MNKHVVADALVLLVGGIVLTGLGVWSVPRSEAFAAWAQAVFSAVAIYASVRVVNLQHLRELRKKAAADAELKRQRLNSVFQLLGGVRAVADKLLALGTVVNGAPKDIIGLQKARTELRWLIGALEQTDYGQFDAHAPIEAVVVSGSAAAYLLRSIDLVSDPQTPMRALEEAWMREAARECEAETRQRMDELKSQLTDDHAADRGAALAAGARRVAAVPCSAELPLSDSPHRQSQGEGDVAR